MARVATAYVSTKMIPFRQIGATCCRNCADGVFVTTFQTLVFGAIFRFKQNRNP